MKAIHNRILGILLILLMLVPPLAMEVHGAEPIDTLQPVSLSVSLVFSGNGLGGASYKVYKVASFWENGAISLTEPFEDCGISLNPESLDAGAAREMASYVKAKAISPDDEGRTDHSGLLCFPTSGTMLPGIYLVAADPFTEAGFTYEMSPMLVRLPDFEGSESELRYELTANVKSSRTVVKTGTTQAPDQPEASGQPETPSQPESLDQPVLLFSDVPQDVKLPQTGLLWWPVPALILTGIPFLLMGRKKGFYIIGLSFLLAALSLSSYNLFEDFEGRRASENIARELELEIFRPEAGSELLGAAHVRAVAPEAAEDNSDVILPGYVLNPHVPMPEAESNGKSYIGLLEIDTISLKLPVISQWSDQALKDAPARYAGSVYLDNMVIAGHNYKSHFAKLKELREGDLVSFTDMDGNIFTYTVGEVDVLEATAIEEMLSGSWDLTLFTCTLDGTSRVTVRCNRI